ncbi:thiamine pyrophosphate-binding protein [Dictyobacter aurantiacus]|uniref:Acetolactate synthase, large subunit, biosynthetic type n=1 Tax=Dictyobacter aurantiacus TaxID=1936993 RepID=A0A401ZRG5_9CHLR|nr:thiamine pyrophosphate-binding protein [Dictyobacter aurantiacus]GCE09412.1 acetolactate synthase, large subunit, biosynthetic type [Dictyobacter aurantiacus]
MNTLKKDIMLTELTQTLPAVHVLFNALEEMHVSHIFGVPGGPLVPLFAALSERQHIQPILAKHEEGAAFMAEGYARVRRSLGVCCATSGPGATNAFTGVASAHSDSIPVLALTGQVATSAFGKGGVQDSSSGNWNVDVVDAYRAATKLSLMLQSGEQMPHMIRRMVRTALTGRTGAVHLNLPADVIKQMAPVSAQPVTKFYTRTLPSGDPQAVQDVASVLRSARKPALLVGHGINLSGAWEPLQRLAEHLAIPVATTLKGKSAFPERHPLSLGVFGFGGHPLAEAYIYAEDVDAIVVIGTSLGEFQTNGWDPRLAASRTVIQIDIDPLEIGKNYPVDYSIVGDANAVLLALTDTLSQGEARSQHDFYTRLHALREQHPRYYHAEALQAEAPVLKPQAVVTKMNDILPDDTLLFVDNGNCLSWAGQFYEARQTGTVFFATNVASMGYAIAAAIGGKIAAPDKPVVALLGDGAFGMNGLEIHTAVDYNLPVIWVVLNNGGHGMAYNGEKLITGTSYLTTYSKPMDVSAIARGAGVEAFTATTLAEFEESLQQALRLQKPCLIEAIVDIEEAPRSLQQRVDTLKAFFGK